MVVHVASRPARAGSVGPASIRHHTQLLTTVRRPHKIVLEEITQQKKALVTVEYHRLEPPIGYTFVPAGHPELTAKCKEFARLKGSKVFVVSTSGPKGNELSQQVHRVGYHFPSDIVRRACVVLNIDLDELEDFLRGAEDWPDEKPRRGNVTRSKRAKKSGHGKKSIDWKNMSQMDLDAQAKAAILDMFPAIPKQNLHEIVDHAFEIGSDRVGVQVSDLSLPRRAQLAVVAHIRHQYTEYDELLKEMSWAEARKKVAPKTLEKLALWRGDKDDEPDTMEDILREVIIISDDEDEEELASPQTYPSAGHRLGNGNLASPSEGTYPSQSHHTYEQDSYRSICDTRRKTDLTTHDDTVDNNIQNTRQQTRHQVWEQTRGRLRQGNHQPTAQQPRQLTLLDSPLPPSPFNHVSQPMQMDTYDGGGRTNPRGSAHEPQGTFTHRSYYPYVQIQEGQPRPYAETELHEPGAYPESDVSSSATAGKFHVRVNATRNRVQSTQSANLRQPQVLENIRPPSRGVSSIRVGDLEYESVLPSIESPRSTKEDASRGTWSNHFLTVVDTPTHAQSMHDERMIVSGPPDRLNPTPPKRRREESPIQTHRITRYRVPQAVVRGAHALQSHTDAESVSKTRKSDQGKIVYLQGTDAPTLPPPVGIPKSRWAIENDRVSHRSYAPSHVSHAFPSGISTARLNAEGRPVPSRSLDGSTFRTVLPPRAVSDAYSVYQTPGMLYDHSGKQVYIPDATTEDRIARADTLRSKVRVQPVERAVPKDSSGHYERLPRRDLPLDQPLFTKSQSTARLVREQLQPPARNEFIPQKPGAERRLVYEQVVPTTASGRFEQIQYEGGMQSAPRVPTRLQGEHAMRRSDSTRDRGYLEGPSHTDNGDSRRLLERPRRCSGDAYQRGWSSSVIQLD